MPLYAPGTRKGNKFYLFREWIAGRQHEVVCLDPFGVPTKDRRVAERYAREFKRTVLANACKDEINSKLTFSQVADICVSTRKLARDAVYLEKLKATDLGTMQIGDIRQADLDRVIGHLYEDCTNETKNRNGYTPAALVLHYAAESEYCAYRRVKKLPEKQPKPRRVATEDMLSLIAATEGEQQRFLRFLYLQGWRVSEALSLHGDHVSFWHNTLRVYVSKIGRWKEVPMHPEVAADLKGRCYPGKRVFSWCSRETVYKWLRPLCRAVGVKFTPHMARHAFASEHSERGATSRDLVDVGTWTNERSVSRYQTATDEHKQTLIARRGTARGSGASG